MTSEDQSLGVAIEPKNLKKEQIDLEKTIKDALAMVPTPENNKVSIPSAGNLPQFTADSMMIKAYSCKPNPKWSTSDA